MSDDLDWHKLIKDACEKSEWRVKPDDLVKMPIPRLFLLFGLGTTTVKNPSKYEQIEMRNKLRAKKGLPPLPNKYKPE